MPSARHAVPDRLTLTEGQAASRDRLSRSAAARRTSVLMAAFRGWRRQGPLGSVSASGCVSVRGSLDDAWIVGTDETPVPFNPTLDDAFMPDAAQITAEVRERLGASVTHYDGVLPAASTP